MRNSDHSPYFCATNLWESSWTTNAVTIPRNAIGIKKKYDAISTGDPKRKKNRLFFENVKENATVRTAMAMSRWVFPPVGCPVGYTYTPEGTDHETRCRISVLRT